jgi:hypothetical protein
MKNGVKTWLRIALTKIDEAWFDGAIGRPFAIAAFEESFPNYTFPKLLLGGGEMRMIALNE